MIIDHLLPSPILPVDTRYRIKFLSKIFMLNVSYSIRILLPPSPPWVVEWDRGAAEFCVRVCRVVGKT